MIPLTTLYETDEVYIVGGGPSAEGMNWLKLKDKFTIGCNKSAFVANTDMLFSIDSTFMKQFYQQMKEFPGMIGLGLKNYDLFKNVPFCDREYIHVRDSRMSEKMPYVYGLNTGHAAINVAMMEGFKTIHVIGIDMNVRGHWHSGYSWSRQHHNVLKRWAADLNAAKPTLDRNGVTIYNYSPHSAVNVYPTRNLKDL